MQSGRNLSMDDRGRKTTAIAARILQNAAKAKATSVINLPEDTKKVKAPPLKAKPAKPDDANRSGFTVNKLKSMYENEQAKAKKPFDEKRTRPFTRPGRGTKPVAENQKVSPATSRGRCETRHSSNQTIKHQSSQTLNAKVVNVELKLKKPEPAPRKTFKEKQLAAKCSNTRMIGKPLITSLMVVSELPKKKNQIPTAKELVPVETVAKTPANLLNSFISSCLDEDRDGRVNPNLDLYLSRNGGVSPAARGKPPVESVNAARDNNGELIIMLRRRNSEPYSQTHYDARNPWRLGCDSICFLQPNLENPCWEVSLFRADRPLSLLNSRTTSDSHVIMRQYENPCLINGQFSIRYGSPRQESKLKPLLPGITHCRETSSASFVNALNQKFLPRELNPPVASEIVPPKKRMPKALSKDDLYKPTAHLRIFVTSSQKKLLSYPASEPGAAAPNKKIHKLTKIRRGSNSEVRQGFWTRNTIVITSAVVFLTGGFLLLLCLLTLPSYLITVKPPAPGILHEY